jgi:hypothetical protein
MPVCSFTLSSFCTLNFQALIIEKSDFLTLSKLLIFLFRNKDLPPFRFEADRTVPLVWLA